jgi:hypothetical protein
MELQNTNEHANNKDSHSDGKTQILQGYFLPKKTIKSEIKTNGYITRSK